MKRDLRNRCQYPWAYVGLSVVLFVACGSDQTNYTSNITGADSSIIIDATQTQDSSPSALGQADANPTQSPNMIDSGSQLDGGSNTPADTAPAQDVNAAVDSSVDSSANPDAANGPDVLQIEGGTSEAGTSEAGTSEAGTSEAGTSEAGTSEAAVPESGTDAGPVADYYQRGPYGPITRMLNQGLGTVSGGSSALLPAGHNNDPSGFTLYYPEGGQPDEKLPLLTFGNGTMCSPTFYDELIEHVVSYGYVVIAPNTSNTGTAVEMLQGVDWALAQNDQASSPIYGKIDSERIGAFGHSQGGAGTCRAGADPRIDTIVPLSGTAEVENIQCSAFFLTTGGEITGGMGTGVETAFNNITTPSAFGVTVSGTHDEYTDKADEGVTVLIGLTSDDALQSRAAVAAWFDWQLKGKQKVGELFKSTPCGFCDAEHLQRLDIKGF